MWELFHPTNHWNKIQSTYYKVVGIFTYINSIQHFCYFVNGLFLLEGEGRIELPTIWLTARSSTTELLTHINTHYYSEMGAKCVLNYHLAVVRLLGSLFYISKCPPLLRYVLHICWIVALCSQRPERLFSTGF